MSEINVVPYIDVMLVLLVIFMVTAPMMMEGVTIDLPAADAKPVAEDRSEPFVVRVDREGAYYLNEDKQPIADLNQIRIKATIVLRNNPSSNKRVWTALTNSMVEYRIISSYQIIAFRLRSKTPF